MTRTQQINALNGAIKAVRAAFEDDDAYDTATDHGCMPDTVIYELEKIVEYMMDGKLVTTRAKLTGGRMIHCGETQY
jgi:hypothetical protein